MLCSVPAGFGAVLVSILSGLVSCYASLTKANIVVTSSLFALGSFYSTLNMINVPKADKRCSGLDFYGNAESTLSTPWCSFMDLCQGGR